MSAVPHLWFCRRDCKCARRFPRYGRYENSMMNSSRFNGHASVSRPSGMPSSSSIANVDPGASWSADASSTMKLANAAHANATATATHAIAKKGPRVWSILFSFPLSHDSFASQQCGASLSRDLGEFSSARIAFAPPLPDLEQTLLQTTRFHRGKCRRVARFIIESSFWPYSESERLLPRAMSPTRRGASIFDVNYQLTAISGDSLVC